MSDVLILLTCVIDLGTGTGIWAIEAGTYSHISPCFAYLWESDNRKS